ncbi:PRD domain-containing protein [Oceanobacillus sp. FSL W8-0428]|uniref:Transcription antiterminator LicT n=1 Tax=Oceanobacillus sojae TaxID=582851 RepID=A0A511ZNW3_9BACI|nr:PRD domain-containing protein [Oceanobacillus sojae]MCT1905302.1 PRD domain-containing protein [Oceanobacillus sojae]GEN89142.1 transcription antiterminator LicT [Oceanobacillus sojae]
MKIRKILNNSAVITRDSNNKEIIVMGKGIAYNKKNGDSIDQDKVYKTFSADSQTIHSRIIEMIDEIPVKYIDLSEQIINIAKEKLETPLNDSIYISLTDHIYTSIQRYHEGIPLKNKLQWEIKHFYQKEFEIGQEAVMLIKNETGISMLEDEAGFIAVHIVSAELDGEVHNSYQITNFIQQITHIVKYYFSIEFDVESLAYHRFVTHLKFFGHRIFLQNNKKENPLDNDLLEIIKEKYVQPYLCSLKIKEYVEQKYDYILDNDELLYLTIHIAKIIKQ